MTALRRMMIKALGGTAAATMLALAVPAAAQDSSAQNSDAPIDVTAAPPPSDQTVGPAQLRDFNLQGTVTRPADRPAPTQTQPSANTPTQPQAPATTPDTATSAAPSERESRETATARTARPAGSNDAPVVSGPTPTLPVSAETGPAPQRTAEGEALATPTSLDPASFLSWPWLAALIALIAGGTFIVWSRRGRRQRYSDPGRMAFAGLAPDVLPEAQPVPPARPTPTPPRAQPAPQPDPVPPKPAQPAKAPADDGLIVSKRLKPQIALEFQPDRAVVTEREVVLQFDLVILNQGTAPARDVLVEAKLITANAAQDREIAAFFHQPQGQGDRMAGIAPFGKLSLKSAVRLPLDQLHSFEVEGRRLFVPLVALNILYRSGTGEEQTSASYLVGRGNETDEKLAPFRIDLGPRIFRGLSARPHSSGLQTQAA
jgi:hypothetical protein